MTNTHTFESVQPPTADLLMRTAQSRGVIIDRLLREMLVVYTAGEVAETTVELQRSMNRGITQLDDGDAKMGSACPYCRCAETVNVVGSFGEYSLCRCSSVYYLHDTFVEVSDKVRNEELRIIVELIESEEIDSSE